MKLKVEAIGTVKKAEVNLSGITLVAGDNSSGKSTISKSLYIMQDVCYSVNDDIALLERRSKNSLLGEILVKVRNNTLSFEMNRRRMIEQRELLRLNVSQILEDEFISKEDAISKLKMILGDFSVNTETIDRVYDEYKEVQERKEEYYFEFIVKSRMNDLFSGQVNTLKSSIEGNLQYLYDEMVSDIIIKNDKILNVNIQNACSKEMRPIYITTADLMEPIKSYQTLRGVQRAGGVSKATEKLCELMMQEVDMQKLSPEEYYEIEKQKQVLQEIFNTVLDGELYLEKERMAYYDKKHEGDIVLSNIASGMKLFLILQRLINNGSFLERTCLIIDEPETNLHPAWQLRLAELLVLMHKKLDILIYVNSHSPYFVRAIEYYAHDYAVLDKCSFYLMEKEEDKAGFISKDVTECLGEIYDKLAEPFNKVF